MTETAEHCFTIALTITVCFIVNFNKQTDLSRLVIFTLIKSGNSCGHNGVLECKY